MNQLRRLFITLNDTDKFLIIFRQRFCCKMFSHPIETFLANIFVAGAAAAFAKTLIAPIERTKLILQNQDSSLHVLTQKVPKYKNALDVFERIPKEQV